MPDAPLQPGIKPVVLLDQFGNPYNASNPIVVAATLPPLASVSLNDAGSGATEAQVKSDGIAYGASPNDGALLVAGREDGTPNKVRHLRTTAAGALITSGGGNLSTNIGSRHNFSVGANVDIFASDAVVPRDGLIDIGLCCALDGVWSLKLTRAASLRICKIDRGNTIVNGNWEYYVFPVIASDLINFRVSTGVQTVSVWANFRDA